MKNRTCIECGRYLSSLESQRKGIGPTCARRRRERLEAGFKERQVEEARELRRRRKLSPIRPGVYRVKSGENVYLTARNTCNCPSGRYRPVAFSCKHTLAVQLEEVGRG